MMKISIAEQYMFEIYQLKEFIDAGLGNIYPFVNRNSIDLFDIIKYSDKALMGILKKLGENIS